MGALHRLFANGFAVSLLRMLLEVADFGTDSIALYDVLSNPALAAFHKSYTSVYVLVALVSCYILTYRGKEVRRKYLGAKKAAVAPLGGGDEASSPTSVALAMIKEGITEAVAFVTDLEAGTAVEALKGELVDAVAIKAAERTQRDLAEDVVVVGESVDESK